MAATSARPGMPESESAHPKLGAPTTGPPKARPAGRTTASQLAGWALVLGLLVICLLAPKLFIPSFLRTLSAVFMFATLAQAWNIIGGFTGYPSFGNVVFFGLGGYTIAVLMARSHWSFWPALVVAVVLGAAYAMLIGIPTLRLKGHYFAIATLGVAEGTREIVLNVPKVTGGGAGITVPAVGPSATTSYPGNTGFLYYFLALLVVAMLAVYAIARSRFGFALRAINQDEDAAAAAGINTTRMKIAAFMVSGAITAAAGSIYAFQQVSIYPDRLFSVDITVLMVIMAVIGGSGTVIGPLVGAVGLQFLSEYLRQNFTDYHTFIFGAIIIVAVVLLPEGAVRFASETVRQRRLPIMDNLRRYRL
jgi:branched-chain amino acid transport system permease protein